MHLHFGAVHHYGSYSLLLWFLQTIPKTLHGIAFDDQLKFQKHTT